MWNKICWWRQTALPKPETAQEMYLKVLRTEAANRKGRKTEEWIMAERIALFNESARQARYKGDLRALSMDEIKAMELISTGADYAEKLCLRLAVAATEKNNA